MSLPFSLEFAIVCTCDICLNQYYHEGKVVPFCDQIFEANGIEK